MDVESSTKIVLDSRYHKICAKHKFNFLSDFVMVYHQSNGKHPIKIHLTAKG